MSTAITTAQVIDRSKFTAPANGMPGEEEYKANIDVGPKITLPAVIQVTARKNGTLKIANLSVRILDEYDDGSVFVGGLLHVEFSDVSGDGYKDLVITGVVAHTGEKDAGPVTYSAVTVIYLFDVKRKAFDLKFRTGPSLTEK